MGLDHVTLRDLCEYALGVLLLGLLLLPTGFVVGWCGNVLDFRNRPWVGQLGLALLLSLAVCPIITFLLGIWLGTAAVWVAYALAGLALVPVLWQRFRGARVADDGAFWPAVVAGLVWLILVGFCTVDLESAGGLYRPTLHYDHAKHSAVTAAVQRSGIPPVNPSFHPGESRPLFYYYFWQMLGGLAAQLGGALVTPRTVAFAGCAWAGFALLAVVHLWLSTFHQARGARPYWIAYGLLLVTGLDFVPSLSMALGGDLPPHIEAWNGCHVTAWVGLGLWVPHHLAALAALVLVWVLLLSGTATGWQPGRLLLMALALASAFGLSIWVTLVAGAGLAAWGLYRLVRARWHEVAVLAALAVLAGLLLVPFVLSLKQTQPDGRAPVALRVRQFLPAEFANPGLASVHPGLVPLAHLALLPLSYALEFGVLFLGACYYWHWRRAAGASPGREDEFLAVLALTTVLVCGLVASAIRNNDLGMRGTALAQFCLLIWTVPVLSGAIQPPPEQRATSRRLLAFCLVVGFLGTAYEVAIGRTLSPGSTGAEPLALRQAYQWLDAHAPATAVVQHSWHDPSAPQGGVFHIEGPSEPFHLLYGHRQAVVSDEMHGMLFGISRARFEPVAADMERLFAAGCGRDEARDLCAWYGITVLVVKRADAIAADPTGWANRTRPDFANAAARVYFLDSFESLAPTLDSPAERLRHADRSDP